MERKNRGFETACEILPPQIREAVRSFSSVLCDTVQEIILRREREVVIETTQGRYYLTENRCLVRKSTDQPMLLSSAEDIRNTFMKLCSYSVHSFQPQINEGFITTKGGLRAGVCGEAVLSNGIISNIKHITSLNIRIAREHIGCADALLSQIDPLKGVLICGPPSSGKTSILRDMARTLSYSCKISLIDERNELSASVLGRHENDIGLCDVYVGYPKHIALMQAMRTQSPDIIALDELGGEKELEALKYASLCGASFIATAHGDSADRPMIRSLLSTDAFRYAVILNGRQKAGKVKEIICSD